MPQVYDSDPSEPSPSSPPPPAGVPPAEPIDLGIYDAEPDLMRALLSGSVDELKVWVEAHRTPAMLAGFGVGVLLGVMARR